MNKGNPKALLPIAAFLVLYVGLGAVLGYQLAWCVLTLALPVLKKP